MDMALLLIYHPVALLVTDGTQASTGKATAQLSVIQEIPFYFTLPIAAWFPTAVRDALAWDNPSPIKWEILAIRKLWI